MEFDKQKNSGPSFINLSMKLCQDDAGPSPSILELRNTFGVMFSNVCLNKCLFDGNFALNFVLDSKNTFIVQFVTNFVSFYTNYTLSMSTSF